MTNDKSQELDYSVVLPVFNEEECLESIVLRIVGVLESLNKRYEIICVDDGSSDKTWGIINELSRKNKNIKGVSFQRNFGHQMAIYAGIQHSSGRYIALMDSDGQDPPEVLPQFFNKCQEGYDVVYAVRKKRKERLLKKMAYNIFYRIYKKIVPFSVPLDSGDFGVFNRDVARFLSQLPEKTPFIRGLRSWYGGRQIGLEYERHARLSGEPKYSFYKLALLAVNGSISFSKIPLRFFSVLGLITSISSFVCGIILLVYKFMVGVDVAGWTSTALLIIFFGGLNLMVFGVTGEYIGNIFDEVKARPRYLVRQTLNF